MRKIFIVTASGPEAYGHYQDTIKRRRSLTEISRFVSSDDVKQLDNIYHGKDFAIWGATPGSGNTNTWVKMYPGDYVVFYQQGNFILIGEVACKFKNKELAKFLWGTNKQGDTWENIYFIINEKEIKVPLEKFNQYLRYRPNFTPQGFGAVESRRQKEVEKRYGDFYGLILRINEGKINEIKELGEQILEHKIEILDDNYVKEPTEHDEIQWRLIRLGKITGNDVWIPKNDQNKIYKGSLFRDFVLKEFEPGLDIPRAVENIDCVWRYGFQIKSAFEIEHSTAIYSGILRLADLKSVAPNSNYPLIIVARRDLKPRIHDQVKRPAFSNPYLKLNEAIKFLSYETIRELDQKFSDIPSGITTEMVLSTAEIINNAH